MTPQVAARLKLPGAEPVLGLAGARQGRRAQLRAAPILDPDDVGPVDVGAGRSRSIVWGGGGSPGAPRGPGGGGGGGPVEGGAGRSRSIVWRERVHRRLLGAADASAAATALLVLASGNPQR